MILQDTFDFEGNKRDVFITLPEYYRTVIAKIVRRVNEFTMNTKNPNPDIFVGWGGIECITDTGGFTFHKISNSNLLGYLMGRKIYISMELKENEVIIGDYNEVLLHLNVRNRKAKLLKLNSVKDQISDI